MALSPKMLAVLQKVDAARAEFFADHLRASAKRAAAQARAQRAAKKAQAQDAKKPPSKKPSRRARP